MKSLESLNSATCFMQYVIYISVGQTTVINKTMVKSHKPAHKPKTYAQQLQELQPAKTVTGENLVEYQYFVFCNYLVIRFFYYFESTPKV